MYTFRLCTLSGRNSAYLINSGSQLAVLYNDTTVLENHHCALGYKLTISHESVNIFQVRFNQNIIFTRS